MPTRYLAQCQVLCWSEMGSQTGSSLVLCLVCAWVTVICERIEREGGHLREEVDGPSEG